MEFVKAEYSAWDMPKTRFGYALEYMATLARWSHPFEDFKLFYNFSKNTLGGTGGRAMPHVQFALNEYVEGSAKGWPDFGLFQRAYQFHQTEVAGVLTTGTDSAKWAMRFVRVNRVYRLGFDEFRKVYGFAKENFSSFKTASTHCDWALDEIFALGVPWDRIMARYQGGGALGLDKKGEVTDIAQEEARLHGGGRKTYRLPSEAMAPGWCMKQTVEFLEGVCLVKHQACVSVAAPAGGPVVGMVPMMVSPPPPAPLMPVLPIQPAQPPMIQCQAGGTVTTTTTVQQAPGGMMVQQPCVGGMVAPPAMAPSQPCMMMQQPVMVPQPGVLAY